MQARPELVAPHYGGLGGAARGRHGCARDAWRCSAMAGCTRWSTMPACRQRRPSRSGSAASTATLPNGAACSSSISSRRWLLARGLAGPLAKAKGAIVNLTSIAGHRVHPFAGSAYSTSKAALSALTREMAADFAELGVRVNAVAPGEIATAMLSPETEVLLPRIPLAPARQSRGCRRHNLLSLQRRCRLCHGHGNLRHRRPAPLLTVTSRAR